MRNNRRGIQKYFVQEERKTNIKRKVNEKLGKFYQKIRNWSKTAFKLHCMPPHFSSSRFTHSPIVRNNVVDTSSSNHAYEFTPPLTVISLWSNLCSNVTKYLCTYSSNTYLFEIRGTRTLVWKAVPVFRISRFPILDGQTSCLKSLSVLNSDWSVIKNCR